jgi:hypothetical protein
MKDTAYQILGKTVIGICIRYSAEEHVLPRSQLFLVFDDGSSYEFYCYRDAIRPTRGLNPGQGMEAIDAYMAGRHFNAYRAEINTPTGAIEHETHDR